MTTLAEAKESIYQRFVDNFTGVASSRIAFENDKFDTPTSGDWVRLSIRNTGRVQSTLGKANNRKFRSTAVVIIQVFTRVDTGVYNATTLAEEALGIFEGVSFSGLDFQASQISEIGPDGPWYQVNVSAEFDFDEIK